MVVNPTAYHTFRLLDYTHSILDFGAVFASTVTSTGVSDDSHTASAISALTSATTIFNFLLAILYRTYETGGVDVAGVGGLNVAVGTNLFQLIN